jgi:hypothetical protein
VPYAVIVEIGVESVDWKTQGDEWLHRVSECMRDIKGFGITGHKFDTTTAPFIEVTSTRSDGTTNDTQFLIVPLDAGLFVAVGSRADDQPDEAAAGAWAQAARCATERLGSRGTEFEWTALLGPPAVRISGAEPAIDGEAMIGPFHVASAEQPMREMLPPHTPSLHSAGQGISWPILVEGRHEGYNWPAAAKKAAFELHRLAALLSLALGDCLVVRDGPAPHDWGVRQVPEQIWWQKETDGVEPDDPPTQPRNLTAVPDWLPGAWTVMQNRPKLGYALDVYHEGLRAQLEHPSLALVAFVASVEAISNMLFITERCSECGSHKGVAARFRATLRLVADEATAEQLGKAYSPRSRTVHQGRLHGAETTQGAHGFSWNDPAREFEWGLWAMRKASGDLLRLALRDEFSAVSSV